jgi:hypothetical protein
MRKQAAVGKEGWKKRDLFCFVDLEACTWIVVVGGVWDPDRARLGEVDSIASLGVGGRNLSAILH